MYLVFFIFAYKIVRGSVQQKLYANVCIWKGTQEFRVYLHTLPANGEPLVAMYGGEHGERKDDGARPDKERDQVPHLFAEAARTPVSPDGGAKQIIFAVLFLHC